MADERGAREAHRVEEGDDVGREIGLGVASRRLRRPVVPALVERVGVVVARQARQVAVERAVRVGVPVQEDDGLALRAALLDVEDIDARAP